MMGYEKDVKITFYNMEDGEEVSDEYSEFLMINRDGEVFELVHNGRGDYKPSYEGDWVGYKMESIAKSDEYEARAEAFDAIVGKYEGIMKDVRNRKFKVTSDVTLLGLEAEKVIKKYESGDYDAKK